MKVTEFFVGFGPRLWSFRQGETEYGVKAIPAGGYVRIIGMSNLEEIDPDDEPRTYRSATTANKLKVILAGVTVNLLIAFLLFFVVIVGNGEFEARAPPSSRVIADERRGRGRAAVRRHDRRHRRHADRRAGTTSARTCDPTPASRSRSPSTRDGAAGRGHRDARGVATARASSASSPNTRAPDVLACSRRCPSRSARWARVTDRDRRRAGEAVLAVGRGAVRQDRHEPGRAEGGRSASEERPALAHRHRRPTAATSSAATSGCCWSCSATISLILALFNLIPLLPFDGGHAAVAIYECDRVEGQATAGCRSTTAS